ncbi:MAG TPA: hypothetical protein VF466_01565 [Candidatus Saccharimonadales bacterium]
MFEHSGPVPTEMSRRNFLRMAVAVPVGAAAAMVLEPTAALLEDNVNERTSMHAGNANWEEQVGQACGPQPADTCVQQFDDSQAGEAVLGAPVWEEATFRAIPSLLHDIITKQDEYDFIAPPRNVLVGSREARIGMTRAELVTGAITTALFAASHNGTARGFNTHTVPLTQAIGGGVFWWLQRRFGYFSNTTAHMASNGLGVLRGRRR